LQLLHEPDALGLGERIAGVAAAGGLDPEGLGRPGDHGAGAERLGTKLHGFMSFFPGSLRTNAKIGRALRYHQVTE
jgi:hypothetical protein